jgi:hypothetical protein
MKGLRSARNLLRGKAGFLLGFAVGYVLGSKAGEQRFRQLADPAVTAGRAVARVGAANVRRSRRPPGLGVGDDDSVLADRRRRNRYRRVIASRRAAAARRAPGPGVGDDDSVLPDRRRRDRDRRRRDPDHGQPNRDDGQDGTTTTQTRVPPFANDP